MLRVARGSASWLITPLTLAILLISLSGPLDRPWLVQLSAVPFFLFMAFWFFYRDPERRTGPGMVSPADGKVVRIDTVDDADLGPCDRVAVFMSPLVVHVNRFPIDGDVREVRHFPGKHLPAFSKDSDRNERVATRLKTAVGDVKVIQIAGTVARRIVPYVEPGHAAKAGQRLGLIRLGSRCDVLVPVGRVAWTVGVGDRVLAGTSQIAEVLQRRPVATRALEPVPTKGEAATQPGAQPGKADVGPRQAYPATGTPPGGSTTLDGTGGSDGHP